MASLSRGAIALSRALRALVLLADFYLVALAILGVLVGADAAAWIWAPPPVAIKVTVLSAVLGFPVLRGTFALGASTGEEKEALPLTEAEQPELCGTVRSLAGRSGTRPPDEILLTEEVNAAVSEDARLLGLLPGRRRLYLGVPLLTGLSEPQLHSVIAHELGHYSDADTRMAGITRRGRDCVLRTVAAFQEREQKRIGKDRSNSGKMLASRALMRLMVLVRSVERPLRWARMSVSFFVTLGVPALGLSAGGSGRTRQ
ncbi:M48 family metallopeptidase [Streptomyces aureoversilis]|uniref:M48 family metallopeptidase n=1 Tax=Streptomyces aureoversilis TaxID=67277 RepID=A0ABW0A8A1_9ACTN